jgi:hypothetical protein
MATKFVKPQHGNKRWAALVLPIAAAVASTTTTLFSVLPSPPPLPLPPMLAEETNSRYTQLRAMIMDAKFVSGRKKENSLFKISYIAHICKTCSKIRKSNLL